MLFSLIVSWILLPNQKPDWIDSQVNSKVVIEVGDLFKKNTHIIVGTNDVFDTALGSVIKPTSVQGQFTKKFYNSNARRLDTEIANQIKSKGILGKIDGSKTEGKNTRLLENAKNTYFSAYCYMNNDLTSESNAIGCGTQ